MIWMIWVGKLGSVKLKILAFQGKIDLEAYLE